MPPPMTATSTASAMLTHLHPYPVRLHLQASQAPARGALGMAARQAPGTGRRHRLADISLCPTTTHARVRHDIVEPTRDRSRCTLPSPLHGDPAQSEAPSTKTWCAPHALHGWTRRGYRHRL